MPLETEGDWSDPPEAHRPVREAAPAHLLAEHDQETAVAPVGAIRTATSATISSVPSTHWMTFPLR